MPPPTRLATAAITLVTCLCAAGAARAADDYPNTSGFGVPFSADEAWYRQCKRVEKRAAPDPAPARADIAKCDAGDLYYARLNQADTSQAEWNAVRACATAHADNAVLAMLFANGLGVPRDADTALHYACAMEHVAKAEMVSRVAHLAAPAGTEVRRSTRFDQCDDITSGYMGSVCAAIREDVDGRVRTARLERLAATLPAPSRAAFARLRAAAERYVGAADGEVDMQGTAAPALALEHQGKLREQFMQAALDAAAGRLPPASGPDHEKRDAELNALYKNVMALPSTQDGWPDRIGSSTIEHASVRATERLWLAYRDAFAAFAATLPSGPDTLAARTLLTGQRAAQLGDLLLYR